MQTKQTNHTRVFVMFVMSDMSVTLPIPKSRLFVIILYSPACGYDMHFPSTPRHFKSNKEKTQVVASLPITSYLQMLFTSLGRITTYAGLFDTRLFNSRYPPFSLLPFGHLFGQPRLSSHSIHFQSTSCFQSAGSELNKPYRRTRIV